MPEFVIPIVCLIITCLLCAPVALIIGIVAINKINALRSELKLGRAAGVQIAQPTIEKPAPPVSQPLPPPFIPVKQEPAPVPQPPPPLPIKPAVQPRPPKPQEVAGIPAATTREQLEQRIGTRWILFAGVFTVFVGIAFFLKYAYDNNLVGAMGRVVIAAAAGVIALLAGEFTRRRGYGIVAKGVTALGFAVLYAAVFSAYRFYDLIGSSPAFILAFLVTAASMLYAVSLDEIVIAFLALLGAFLTPILVSTGQNLPLPLFAYTTVISIGAILCAFYRKWRAINILAFIGTFALYTGWFEKFYRTQMSSLAVPNQMAIALAGLGVFFAIYLVLPVLYELIKKTKAYREDVLLILANAVVTFYYLWTILMDMDRFRVQLAFCALGLSAIHLFLMSVAARRCPSDILLRLSLLLIGLFFLTIAIPLYLKMYAIAVAWAIEAVILTVVGLKYRSILTSIGGGIVLILSCANLISQLPLHQAAFHLVFNPPFGTWCLVAAAFYVCHLIYRRTEKLPEGISVHVPQIFYCFAIVMLFAAAWMEWETHCKYNFLGSYFQLGNITLNGHILIAAAALLLAVIRPLCPKGILCKIFASIAALAGTIFMLYAFFDYDRITYPIFRNPQFILPLLYIVALAAAAVLLYQQKDKESYAKSFSFAFALATVFVLWILLTSEIYTYWSYKNVVNWQFLAQMYISVMWAVYAILLMAVGFAFKVRTVRFISFGLIALLLLKVFIADMSTVKSVYRIAAFLATGIALVTISYLYQYLKKKGFFDTSLAERIQSMQNGTKS